MKKSLLIVLLFILSQGIILATEEQHSSEDHAEKKEFNVSSFIFDHITDSHEWHIATYKGKHISIPLPIILYSKNSGWHFFMSSEFHHGHSDYSFNGGKLRLMLEGENKGKIVELDEEEQEISQLPIDLSITKNVAALMISLAIMLWIFIRVAKTYSQQRGRAPTGLQNFIEAIVIFIREEVAKPSIGEKKHERFMPYLLMVFFFILLNNLLGLIPLFPGGANVTGNINITFLLAILTFLTTNLSSNKSYWKHIFNAPGVPWWLKFPLPIIPMVEFLGLLSKPFALMIRLFANITAGHIIILAFYCLIFFFGNIHYTIGLGTSLFSIPFTIFMTLLELLVAFVQAFIFTLLSATFIGAAVEEQH
ncbi:ATP synthase F0 subunit A [Prolixibacteraceae bacterium JC049]|nr:ATP synthase F0 subunit A [Prolixibacteraceae bacterium JC049]